MDDLQRYSVLVADCPWPFGDKLGTRGAEANYPVLSITELARFPLPPLADDCTLFFWRVASMQQEALDVIRAWGFGSVKSELIWLKKTIYGERWFGMGRTVRMEHEVCLIAQRGRPPTLDMGVRSTFETSIDISSSDVCEACAKSYRLEGELHYDDNDVTWGVCRLVVAHWRLARGLDYHDCIGFEAIARRHSEKPNTFYQIVELLKAGPYVELFARRQRAGWTCLGNEMTL